MVMYTDKQSDFQEWQEAQQTTDISEICVTISNSKNQAPGIKCLPSGT